MKFFLTISISIILIFISRISNCQDTLIHKKQYKKLYFYTWGLPKFRDDIYRDCELSLQEDYGFGKKIKAGCLVKRGQSNKWQKHNDKIEEKMKRRHGNEWRDKFNLELKNCLKVGHTE